jgi:pyruvate dehydrogenase E1 component alpha subunit
VIVADTYRFMGHNVSDAGAYRTAEEVQRWRERDPITRFAALLAADGVVSSDEAAGLAVAADEEVAAALAFAEASPAPPPEAAFVDVLSAPYRVDGVRTTRAAAGEPADGSSGGERL